MEATIHFKLAGSCHSPTFKQKELSGFEVIPRIREKIKFFDDPMVYRVYEVHHEAGYDFGNLVHNITVILEAATG